MRKDDWVFPIIASPQLSGQVRNAPHYRKYTIRGAILGHYDLTDCDQF